MMSLELHKRIWLNKVKNHIPQKVLQQLFSDDSKEVILIDIAMKMLESVQIKNTQA